MQLNDVISLVTLRVRGVNLKIIKKCLKKIEGKQSTIKESKIEMWST